MHFCVFGEKYFCSFYGKMSFDEKVCFCGFSGKMRFAVLAGTCVFCGKMRFSGFRGNMYLCVFGGKMRFPALVRKKCVIQFWRENAFFQF